MSLKQKLLFKDEQQFLGEISWVGFGDSLAAAARATAAATLNLLVYDLKDQRQMADERLWSLAASEPLSFEPLSASCF